MDCFKVRDKYNLIMEISIKVTSAKKQLMAIVAILGKMVPTMLVNGLTIKWMGLDSMFGILMIVTQESGAME
jgi:hypothetical protein